MTEADIQAKLRLKASQCGMRLWRNNVGVLCDSTGRPIRYGLANDSAELNKVLKSSDLIGIRPVVITQDMVGKTIGQFVAREVKSSSWIFRNTNREKAQLAFINLINSLGGDAKFYNGEDDL
jgi:hypothetical protein